MIKLGNTVLDTKYGNKKLVVGETVSLEAVERLSKRFVGEEPVKAKPVKVEEPVEEEEEPKKSKSEEKRKEIQKPKK